MARVLLRDVNKAAADYQSWNSRYGSHDQGSLNRYAKWRELQTAYETQTGKPLYKLNPAGYLSLLVDDGRELGRIRQRPKPYDHVWEISLAPNFSLWRGFPSVDAAISYAIKLQGVDSYSIVEKNPGPLRTTRKVTTVNPPKYNAMQKRIQFFAEHAGYATPPGKMGTAKLLAKAEEWASAEGVEFQVYDDPDADLSFMSEEEQREPHEVIQIIATHPENGRTAALSGIVDATPNYRRVVAAELALELMNEE